MHFKITSGNSVLSILRGLTILLAIHVLISTAYAGENLFTDPSFEKPQPVNRYGQCYPHWPGWIYGGTASNIASRVARTGTYSYGMVSDLDGNIALLSPTMKLEPGRYQVKLFLRGLGVGEGEGGNSMLFSPTMQDGQYYPIKKSGTFGWTPVTCVFDIDPSNSSVRFFLRLRAGGWIWVDDISLEKVGSEVPLTSAAVLEKEESPFTPSGESGKDAVRCPLCGVLNSSKRTDCYGCGQALPSRVKATSPASKIIADFEDNSKGGFVGGTVVTGETPQGKRAFEANGVVSNTNPQDWSEYDYFCFDVWNPEKKPVSLVAEIRDAQTKGYWTRVNYSTLVPPGISTIRIPTALYVGEKSRPGRPLLRKQITGLFLSSKSVKLVYDNFRLERLDVAEHVFPGLLAFDFGKQDAPTMEGFFRVTGGMRYDPARGFGWEKANFWKAFNVLQPDTLTQSFICPRRAGFRVDVPNGRYHVILNIDSPGGYWGEVQTYKRRRVLVNGKAIIDDEMDINAFKKKYFRNAHHEDLPGVNTFAEYVQPMFHFREFDVDVTDGVIRFDFEGDGWAICLSSLVLYPVEASEKGNAFWQWVTQRRKAQFDEYFKQVIPQPTGAARPKANYVVFSRHFMKEVHPYDGPEQGEVLSDAGLALRVAQDEEAALTFSVQPSDNANLGGITLDVSDFVLDGSQQRLPASSIRAGWLDYRITRMAMDGSVYTVAPRYWHPAPAPSAPKVTRIFWLRIKPPVSTASGTYKGTVTVKPEHGQNRKIPVSITVLPFTLDPISDLAVGPWGCSIPFPWIQGEPETAQWAWSMFEKSIAAIKDTGSTSLSGLPRISVEGANGALNIQYGQTDRQMQRLRKEGFRKMISSYGAGVSGYRMRGDSSGPDAEAARAAGFDSPQAYLKALYQAVDKYAIANDWLPVAWNICDEPVDADIAPAIRNAQVHRQAVKGLKRTTVMGATSMQGANPSNPHYELVRALPIPALTLHDEAALIVLRDAGNRFCFYNAEDRWTMGRYMKMLQVKHDLYMRLVWHFNNVAGDPYYALDCREDDFCWFNTDADQTMVPSTDLLQQIIPGLNDYRYLCLLERLLKEKPKHPAASKAKKVFDQMMDLQAGPGRQRPSNPAIYDADRQAVTEAIVELLNP